MAFIIAHTVKHINTFRILLTFRRSGSRAAQEDLPVRLSARRLDRGQRAQIAAMAARLIASDPLALRRSKRPRPARRLPPVIRRSSAARRLDRGQRGQIAATAARLIASDPLALRRSKRPRPACWLPAAGQMPGITSAGSHVAVGLDRARGQRAGCRRSSPARPSGSLPAQEGLNGCAVIARITRFRAKVIHRRKQIARCVMDRRARPGKSDSVECFNE